MNLAGIEQVVYAWTGEHLSASSYNKNVYISCPLAEYTHPGGSDTSKGFSIKVDPFGNSPCYCFHPQCNFRGTLFGAITEWGSLSGVSTGDVLGTYYRYAQVDPLDLLSLADNYDFEVSTTTSKILDKSILEQYPPFRKEWRGLLPETLERWDVRFDKQKQRIIFPVYTKKGELFGVVGRTINNHSIKYLNYFDFKKTEILFGEGVDNGKEVIILEGQVDAQKTSQAVNFSKSCVALMGSHPSRIQIAKIKEYYDRAVLFLDRDSAGSRGTQILVENLIDEIDLAYTWLPYRGNDPGAIDDSTIRRVLDSSVQIKRKLNY